MKRLITCLLLALLAFTPLLANGGSEDAAAGESTKLTVLKAGSESSWDNYYNASFDRYNATGKNTEFEYSSVGWAEVDTKINLMFAGGNAPDIVASAVGAMAVRASKGQFISLDDYYAAWEDKGQFQEAAYQKGLYKDVLYGFSYHWDPRIFVYRKDLFREAGLDPEAPPTNWDELKDYAEKLTKKEGNVVVQSGLSMPSSQTHVFSYIFLNQNGTIMADEPAEIPEFTDPAAVETFEFLAELYEMGISSPYAGNKSAEDPWNKGMAAMGFTTPSQLNQFEDSHPDLAGELGFIYNLKKKKEATFGGIYQYFITNQSKNPDAAWDYMTYMLSVDETKARIDAINSPPTRDDVMDYFMGKSRFNEAIMKSALISKPWPNVVWGGLYRRHLDEVGMETYMGVATATDSLAEHQKQLEAELAQ